MRVRVKKAGFDALFKPRNQKLGDFALEMGTGLQYLSAIIRGKAEPGPDFRQRLMDTLGATYWDELFELVPAAADANGHTPEPERAEVVA